MSGGHLQVLDRAGREVKQFDLPSGLVTLGSSSASDIRFMLPSVEPHHATIVVHGNKTVIHNVGAGETLVNGVSVSVAPLSHEDVVSLGGRELRWRYAHPTPQQARRLSLKPGLVRLSRVRSRVAARRSLAPPPRAARSPHRSSTPAAASARQVAVVQPRRRDPAGSIEGFSSSAVSIVTNIRGHKTSKSDRDMTSTLERSAESRSKYKSKSPQMNLQNTTKATLWIESRKSTPRKNVRESPSYTAGTPRKAVSAKKATPLRMAVLKKSQGAHKVKVTKIEAPATIDHTKQAAIMLMTGHTPKKHGSPKRSSASSLVVKRHSVTTPARRPARPSKNTSNGRNSLKVSKEPPDRTVPGVTITGPDDTESSINECDVSKSHSNTSLLSPLLITQRKSALKDPTAKKSKRKTESIKFDLSNLANSTASSVDVLTVSDATEKSHDDGVPGDVFQLRYSSSTENSPSPRKSIYSRSSKILEKTLGTQFTKEFEHEQRLPPESPRCRKSLRAGMMLHKVLETPDNSLTYSHRVRKTFSDQSWDTTEASAQESRTLRLRSLNKDKMETYSVIDLVSFESSGSRSIYNSLSDTSTSKFKTPRTTARRSTRSLRALSPPPASANSGHVPRKPRSRSAIASCNYNSLQDDCSLTKSLSRRTHSIQTSINAPDYATYHISDKETKYRSLLDSENVPEDTFNSSRKPFTAPKAIQDATYDISAKSINGKSRSTAKTSTENITLNSSSGSTRKSRSSQSGARVTDDEISSVKLTNSPIRSKKSLNSTTRDNLLPNGTSTPNNQNSPEEIGTPVLRIQNLLDSSLNVRRVTRKAVTRIPSVRKTTGGRLSISRKRASVKSKTFSLGTRASLRRSNKTFSKHYANADPTRDDGETTPTSSVKLVHEAVKNKHSTAKKPKSKRSIIDNLNESHIVKQLFNSPVKRKLSQSMIEFSKKLLDDETTPPRKATRNTIALTERTLSNSPLEESQVFTPEVFVSPISTDNSPINMGLKRLFAENTPKNDLRDVRGVKTLMQTPRNRRSINDLTEVAGVKSRTRLTDVNIKKLFAASPKNDLRRVSGVKTIFKSQKKNKSPKHDLEDRLRNDSREVCGTKTTLGRHSRRGKPDDFNDISGIEELFSESHQTSNPADTNTENSFDMLIGRPVVRSYTKAKSFAAKCTQKTQTRKIHSLQNSFNLMSNNVEDWLENELKKRMQKDSKTNSHIEKRLNKSKSKPGLSRELLNLTTSTLGGNAPVLTNRARSSTLTKTLGEMVELKKSASEIYGAHTLPIKKRSLVETSRNQSGHKNTLPIKKRLVKHSTPVKSNYNMTINITMNVSDIGRVSPIAAAGDADVTRAAALRPIAGRNKRKSVQEGDAVASPTADNYISPRNKGKTASPAQVRITRNRKIDSQAEQRSVRKRRSSIVITKKAPAMKPKFATKEPLTKENAAKRTRGKNKGAENENDTHNVSPKFPKDKRQVQRSIESPPKNRLTRRQNKSADKVQTPKKIPRAKVAKSTVIITKPSPKMKPRSPQKISQRTLRAKAKANKTNKIDSPLKVQINEEKHLKTRGRTGKKISNANNEANKTKNEPNSNLKPTDEGLEIIPKRRGRNAFTLNNTRETEAATVPTRTTRNTGKQTKTAKIAGNKESIELVKKRSGVTDSLAENIGTRSKRKTTGEKSSSQPRKGNSKDSNTSNRVENIDKKSQKVTRQNTRGRRGNNVDASEDVQTVEKPFVNSRSRSGKIAQSQQHNSPAAKQKAAVAVLKNTRGKAVKRPLVSQESGRIEEEVTKDKRTAKEEAKRKLRKHDQAEVKSTVQNKAAGADQPRAAGRKRKAKEEDAADTILKDSPKQRKARRTAAPSPKMTRGQAAAQRAATRSRRR